MPSPQVTENQLTLRKRTRAGSLSEDDSVDIPLPQIDGGSTEKEKAKSKPRPKKRLRRSVRFTSPDPPPPPTQPETPLFTTPQTPQEQQVKQQRSEASNLKGYARDIEIQRRHPLHQNAYETFIAAANMRVMKRKEIETRNSIWDQRKERYETKLELLEAEKVELGQKLEVIGVAKEEFNKDEKNVVEISREDDVEVNKAWEEYLALERDEAPVQDMVDGTEGVSGLVSAFDGAEELLARTELY